METTKTTKTSKTTKRGELIRLLSRKSGATSPALCATFGWQPHSLRAAISGLRKAGFTIETTRAQDVGGAAVLRITPGLEVR